MQVSLKPRHSTILRPSLCAPHQRPDVNAREARRVNPAKPSSSLSLLHSPSLACLNVSCASVHDPYTSCSPHTSDSNIVRVACQAVRRVVLSASLEASQMRPYPSCNPPSRSNGLSRWSSITSSFFLWVRFVFQPCVLAHILLNERHAKKHHILIEWSFKALSSKFYFIFFLRGISIKHHHTYCPWKWFRGQNFREIEMYEKKNRWIHNFFCFSCKLIAVSTTIIIIRFIIVEWQWRCAWGWSKNTKRRVRRIFFQTYDTGHSFVMGKCSSALVHLDERIGKTRACRIELKTFLFANKRTRFFVIPAYIELEDFPQNEETFANLLACFPFHCFCRPCSTRANVNLAWDHKGYLFIYRVPVKLWPRLLFFLQKYETACVFLAQYSLFISVITALESLFYVLHYLSLLPTLNFNVHWAVFVSLSLAPSFSRLPTLLPRCSELSCSLYNSYCTEARNSPGGYDVRACDAH